MNNKTNCNTQMPSNGIANVNIQPGMYVLLPGGYTGRVTTVKWTGDRGVVVADGIRTQVNRAGSMRLDPDYHPDHHYHSGHGCVSE